MKSATLPSFWKAYESLDKSIRRRARKAYHLWAQNPFHPSLHFKCINSEENIWSVRVWGIVQLVFLMKIRLHGSGVETMMNMSVFSRKT